MQTSNLPDGQAAPRQKYISGCWLDPISHKKNWLRFSPTLPLNFTRGQKVQKCGLDCRLQSPLRCSGFETEDCRPIGSLKHMLEATMIGLCPLQIYFAHPSPSFYRAAWNADAVLRWEFCPSVRPSVCLSNACIVTKRKKNLCRFLHHTKICLLYTSDAADE